MKFSTILFCGVAALSAFAAPAFAKDWTKATITLEGAYAPWNLTNADGTLGGFEPELAKVLCERAKIECTLVASDWDGMPSPRRSGRRPIASPLRSRRSVRSANGACRVWRPIPKYTDV